MSIALAPPTWSTGSLLSAHQLNSLSDAVNALRGASLAPTGVFVTTGASQQTYWMRRRYRYLHARYSIQINDPGENITLTIGSGQYYHNAATANVWRTFDLASQFGAPAVGAWYSIGVSRTGTGATYLLHELRESEASTPTGTGGYSAPSSWTSSEIVTAAKLNSYSAAVLAMAGGLRPPNPATLRAQADQRYTLRRRQRNLEISVTVSGDTNDLDIRVNGTAAYNNVSTGTYTIDLAVIGGGPAYNDAYELHLQRSSGNIILNSLREIPNIVSTHAPSWAHGEQLANAVKLNDLRTALINAYDTIGDVGWQYAAIYRPVDRPRWLAHKTARYLHYMRNGSLPARIFDPAGVGDEVGLRRTTNSALFATYDLDTIDWLAPGGLMHIDECDVVWLDDDP